MMLADDVDFSELVRQTDSFTGADIAAVCKKAGRFALREDINASKVQMQHFLKALEETGPSVTPETTRYYENITGELRTKQAKGIEGVGYA
jgi:transitional endoplasmic reticulum ATPase